jgi:hypothetical protein
MAFDDRLHRMVKVKPSSGRAADTSAIVMAGTTPAVQSGVHPSGSITDSPATGLEGNDYPTPGQQNWKVNHDPGKRYQDIANSHMGEGPNPGRIPYRFSMRDKGKLGRDLSGTPDGTIGLTLGITGVSAGGVGDAMYVPHTSILRPAGKSVAGMRTIDDGAMIPGVFVADPTRR